MKGSPRSVGSRLGGVVVQISTSQGGVPKRAIPQAEVTPLGIVGDAWRYPFHGGRRRAILSVTAEGIDDLIAQGFPLFHGALGENITTRGLQRRSLRIGQRFSVGEVVIELSQMRAPCGTLDVYGTGIQAAMYDARVQAGDTASPRWGLSGFYAAVIQPGTLQVGDPISLVEQTGR